MGLAIMPPPALYVAGLLLLLLLSPATTAKACDWMAGQEAVEYPECRDPPMELLPEDVRGSAPKLFSCQGPQGPVEYAPPTEWVHLPDDCGSPANMDLFVFSGARDRHLLPYLFASLRAFMKCYDLVHVAVPEQVLVSRIAALLVMPWGVGGRGGTEGGWRFPVGGVPPRLRGGRSVGAGGL